jgi:hypothetical protein
MKYIVRAFVLVLAITGAAASTMTPSASAATPSKLAAARVTFVPIPTCPPDDPNACNITGHY